MIHITTTTLLSVEHILVPVIGGLFATALLCALLGINHSVDSEDLSLEIRAEHFFAMGFFVAVVLMFVYLVRISGVLHA